MSDVTFGVKVPEEMKIELSEIMKSTELSGKEFMAMLLSSYKLERSKQSDQILGSDIEELQKLLHRVQNIYLNISERAQLVIEEKIDLQKDVIKQIGCSVQEKEEVIQEKEALYLLEVEKRKSVEETLQKMHQQFEEAEKGHKLLKATVEEQKMHIKQHHLLTDKYDEEIKGLKEEISRYERLEVEIQERNQENQKLRNRTDEMASEVWFLQRELEKLQKEYELAKKQFELELKNELLEQKLEFTKKIELLKDENYKIQQDYHFKIQELLEKRQS